MRLEVHHFHHPDRETAERLCRIENMLGQILQREGKIMASIQDVNAAVSAQTTVEQSVVILLQNLAQQIKDAQASGDPAALDQVVANINANTKALSDAVAANTPAAPPTPPAP